MAVPVLDLPRHKLADVIDRLAAEIRRLEAENARYLAFISSLLNPEENGLAVPAHVRDDARVALGRKRVES